MNIQAIKSEEKLQSHLKGPNILEQQPNHRKWHYLAFESNSLRKIQPGGCSFYLAKSAYLLCVALETGNTVIPGDQRDPAPPITQGGALGFLVLQSCSSWA